MPFFPGVECALDLTPIQVALLEYMSLHESVDNMDPRDKPEDDIINNDEKFDKWIQEFKARKEAEIKYGADEGASKHQRVTKFSPQEEQDDEEI